MSARRIGRRGAGTPGLPCRPHLPFGAWGQAQPDSGEVSLPGAWAENYKIVEVAGEAGGFPALYRIQTTSAARRSVVSRAVAVYRAVRASRSYRW